MLFPEWYGIGGEKGPLRLCESGLSDIGPLEGMTKPEGTYSLDEPESLWTSDILELFQAWKNGSVDGKLPGHGFGSVEHASGGARLPPAETEPLRESGGLSNGLEVELNLQRVNIVSNDAGRAKNGRRGEVVERGRGMSLSHWSSSVHWAAALVL